MVQQPAAKRVGWISAPFWAAEDKSTPVLSSLRVSSASGGFENNQSQRLYVNAHCYADSFSSIETKLQFPKRFHALKENTS
jgi:hypothetical protein